MRKLIILATTLLFLFHFSPQTTEAEENEDPVEKDGKESEQVDSEEGEPESSESEETVESSGDDNNDSSSFETDQENLNGNVDKQEQTSDEVNIQNNSSNNTLEDGIIDDRVIELREQLSVLGFPTTDEPENYYGESTKEAVGEFQAYYSLENVSEIEDIIEQLESVLSTPLQHGGVHPDVVELKENLVSLGFGSFNFNQNYLSTTTRTVEEFQTFYGLKENGIADEPTLNKIQELLDNPMQHGDYRKDVVALKENLAKLGFNVSSDSSPEYDSETESTVEEFQEYYRLDVTGVADDATLDKLEELISTPLQHGGRHEDVTRLKEDLVAVGFGSFNFNQNYLSTTMRVVEEFQEYYGLKVNGIADDRTLEMLESIVNTPLQYGGNHPDVVQLKENLVALGFGSFNFNQNYLSTTEATVEEFQGFYGLKENGIADESTLNKIQELLDNPMERGDYRKDVIDLKENLAKLGFVVSSNPTPQYGPATESTVEEFQEYYKLEVTGVADDATLDKLEELISTPLQHGGRHEDVTRLKEDLVAVGFGSFNFNQNYLSTTTRVVEEFQEYYGLKVNGIADDRTLEMLESILTTHLQQGERNEDVVQLKENLVALGFGSFIFNQNYGSTTAATVREFQAFYDLKENGIADGPTLEKMQELLDTPMQRGDYRKDVVNLKENLARLGFVVSSNPTPQYGPATESTVEEFQKYYKLEVTGVADDATLDKLEELISTPLQHGGRHEDVTRLKEDLVAVGFGSFNFNQNYLSTTTRVVEEFQEYYGLKVNGIADDRTLEMLESIVNTPLQYGGNHPDVVGLKENLVALGFGSFNFNQNYLYTTEATVKEFQSYYGLKVNGIADIRTLDKMEEILNSPLRNGQKHEDVIQLKSDLETLDFGSFIGNTSYGPKTESAVREFQETYDLPVSGIADEVTLAKIEVALTSNRYTTYNLTLSGAVDIQMRLNNPAPQTDKRYAYVSATYVSDEGEVTAGTLNVRSGPSASSKRVGSLSNGTEVNILSEVDGWYQIEFSGAGWVDAARSDVRYYMDPSNFLDDEKQQFQFLDLGRNSAASADLLNDYLVDRGILDGMGQSFINAGNIHGVNDVYLLSHALLETGHGSSPLANGIDVGKNQSGELELVTANNRSSLTDIRTTYNMYGIGAVDGNAYQGGAFRAYNEGWYTPEAAIIDGARFIGNNYVKAGQNTLYKMRWNPASVDENGYASHQYATDIGWAYKQVNTMYNLYQSLNIYDVYLDIPEYLK